MGRMIDNQCLLCHLIWYNYHDAVAILWLVNAMMGQTLTRKTNTRTEHLWPPFYGWHFQTHFSKSKKIIVIEIELKFLSMVLNDANINRLGCSMWNITYITYYIILITCVPAQNCTNTDHLRCSLEDNIVLIFTTCVPALVTIYCDISVKVMNYW